HSVQPWGKPKHSKQQATNECPEKTHAQISEETKAFALPSDHQPSEASPKQPDNNPDDELIDGWHHRSPQQDISLAVAGFSGEAKRVSGPARARGSRTWQYRMSLGRPLFRAFHEGTTGPPSGDPFRLALVFCGGATLRASCAPRLTPLLYH